MADLNPTARFSILAALLAVLAVIIWLVWPWIFIPIISAQATFIGVGADDIRKDYQTFAGPLTAITLALTVLVQFTQYVAMQRASLQASMENQIEGLLDRLGALHTPAQSGQHKELLHLIFAKAARLPIKIQRDEYMSYILRVRLTAPDLLWLETNKDKFATNRQIMGYLTESER